MKSQLVLLLSFLIVVLLAFNATEAVAAAAAAAKDRIMDKTKNIASSHHRGTSKTMIKNTVTRVNKSTSELNMQKLKNANYPAGKNNNNNNNIKRAFTESKRLIAGHVINKLSKAKMTTESNSTVKIYPYNFCAIRFNF